MNTQVLAADIENKVRGYLLENHLFTSDASRLPNDASLLEMGVIDSTGILEVILFLESNFGMSVKDSEMLPENFDSVNNIVRFVQQSLQQGSHVRPSTAA